VAIRLQVKAFEHRLGLWSGMYAASICDVSTVAAVVCGVFYAFTFG